MKDTPNSDEIEAIHWELLREAILSWSKGRNVDFPWRRELPQWQALVTEVLLQRTRAEAVKEMYLDFFTRFPSPRDLADASVGDIEEAILSLGLRWRAKYLQTLGRELEAGVPETSGELLALSGVGPYASAAYLSLHNDQRAPLVDANIVRLLGRYCGFEFDGETRRKRWFLSLVEELFHTDVSPSEFGYAVLDFTREVCGRTPLCTECPAQRGCAYGCASTSSVEVR